MDPGGNLLVADKNATSVYRFIAATNYQTRETLDGQDAFSTMNLDSIGRVFGAVSGQAGVVSLDLRSQPSLTFASTPVGSTSSDSPQVLDLVNSGNATLNWIPQQSADPVMVGSGFTMNPASTCPQVPNTSLTDAELAPGALCTYSFSFAPKSPYDFNSSLMIEVTVFVSCSLIAFSIAPLAMTSVNAAFTAC